MKYLIVNADDYGLSPGVSRGILEAHRLGILTSTSFMVDTNSSVAAAMPLRDLPNVSVGLHADLVGVPDATDAAARCREALKRQLDRFRTLVGRAPSHLDSHHNVHRDPRWSPAFVEVAEQHGIPLREHSFVRYFPKFYGQWSGRSHLEHIGVASLAAMLESEIATGITELSCHPGYPDLESSYNREREVELRTLCDSRLPALIATLGIMLVSYHDVARLTAPGASPILPRAMS